MTPANPPRPSPPTKRSVPINPPDVHGGNNYRVTPTALKIFGHTTSLLRPSQNNNGRAGSNTPATSNLWKVRFGYFSSGIDAKYIQMSAHLAAKLFAEGTLKFEDFRTAVEPVPRAGAIPYVQVKFILFGTDITARIFADPLREIVVLDSRALSSEG